MTNNEERAYAELTKFQSLQSKIRILELKIFISIQAELINKAFMGDEQMTKAKPEIKTIVVHQERN